MSEEDKGEEVEVEEGGKESKSKMQQRHRREIMDLKKGKAGRGLSKKELQQKEKEMLERHEKELAALEQARSSPPPSAWPLSSAFSFPSSPHQSPSLQDSSLDHFIFFFVSLKLPSSSPRLVSPPLPRPSLSRQVC